MNVEQIARAAHEINRAYCQALDDESQAPWDEAPQWQKDSAVAGVRFHLQNPDAGPSASHDNWVRQKLEDGWRPGRAKDPVRKLHPCICPFSLLPREQQAKDYLFRGVVHALALFEGTSVAPGVLDYNDAKKVYSEHLAKDPTGYGRMDSALLKAFEYVFRQGVAAGEAHQKLIHQRQQEGEAK